MRLYLNKRAMPLLRNGGEVRQCPFDRFPETDSEVANSGVARNRVVRLSDDTRDTATVRYPVWRVAM